MAVERGCDASKLLPKMKVEDNVKRGQLILLKRMMLAGVDGEEVVRGVCGWGNRDGRVEKSHGCNG